MRVSTKNTRPVDSGQLNRCFRNLSSSQIFPKKKKGSRQARLHKFLVCVGQAEVGKDISGAFVGHVRAFSGFSFDLHGLSAFLRSLVLRLPAVDCNESMSFFVVAMPDLEFLLESM